MVGILKPNYEKGQLHMNPSKQTEKEYLDMLQSRPEKEYLDMMQSRPLVLHGPITITAINEQDDLTLKAEETTNYKSKEQSDKELRERINAVLEMTTQPIDCDEVFREIESFKNIISISKSYSDPEHKVNDQPFLAMGSYLENRKHGLKTREECETWLNYERKNDERKKNFEFGKWWRNWRRRWLGYGRIIGLSVFREIRRICSKR